MQVLSVAHMAGGDNGPKHFCGDEKKNNEVTSNV